jgi:hypothetical protein
MSDIIDQAFLLTPAFLCFVLAGYFAGQAAIEAFLVEHKDR